MLKIYQSAENGEKAEKEAEAVPEEKVAKEEEEQKVKAKAKKEKQSAGDGFELWNELEVQRIKFMVRFCFMFESLAIDRFFKFSSSVLLGRTNVQIVGDFSCSFLLTVCYNCYLNFRTTCLATSTTCASWLCSSPLL